MAGISGLFKTDRCPPQQEDLDWLERNALEELAGEAPAAERHKAAGIGLLCRPNGASSARVSLDGRLDNRQDLIKVGCGADRHAPDEALILSAYDRWGPDFVTHLNGEFSLALFEPRSHRLTLASDPLGDRRLYYTQTSGTLLFASKIAVILSHPKVRARLDEDGIADRVLNGFDDGHRTCFEGIFSVPPGYQLVASEGGTSLRRYWDFDPDREIRYRSAGDYVDAFRTLFEQAVRRRVGNASAVAVAVSGGVDSSSLFCQALTEVSRGSIRASVRGLSLTFPEGSPSDERVFLEEIEKARDICIVRLPVSKLSHLADSRRLARVSGFPSMTWDAVSSLYSHAKALGCTSIMDGFLADQILFPSNYLVDLTKRMRWKAVANHLRGFAAWNITVPPRVFRDQLRSALIRAAVPRRLFRLARSVGNRARPERIYPRWYTRRLVQRALDLTLNRTENGVHFQTSQGQRYYEIASSAFYGLMIQDRRAAGTIAGIDVLLPFRDRDLLAFLMAIPGEMVNLGGVPKGLLREAMRGVLPEAIRTRRTKADFTAISNRAVTAELPYIRGLFRHACSIEAGLVDGDVIHEQLAALGTRLGESDNALAGRLFIGLASLELWMREFFGDPDERATCRHAAKN